jgi:hypothetical protein
MEEVNLIKIYYKHLCKCHNVSLFNYNMLIVKKKKIKHRSCFTTPSAHKN